MIDNGKMLSQRNDMQIIEERQEMDSPGTITHTRVAINSTNTNVLEHLAVNVSKDLVKNSGSRFRVLIVAYAVFAVVIVSILQSVTIEIVAPSAAIGLGVILFVDRYERQKFFKRFYIHELSNMQNLIRMMDKQQNDPSVIAGTVYALAAAVDAKDHYTYGHSSKVANYAADIAKELGYAEDAVNKIYKAALLHDIGKIGIPEHILTKCGGLTKEEWKVIRSHPDKGVEILKYVGSLYGCLECVRYHHEHYDGTGYPHGLKGENIPLDARILAVADCYDAMTSERPYKPPMTHQEALIELTRCAGTQFDRRVVGAFIAASNLPVNIPLPKSI